MFEEEQHLHHHYVRSAFLNKEAPIETYTFKM